MVDKHSLRKRAKSGWAWKKKLELSDWEKITGILKTNKNAGYIASREGISVVKNDEEFIDAPGWASWNRKAMREQNEAPGLAFPCSPKELLDFVDADPALLGGLFVAEDFRYAVKMQVIKVALKSKAGRQIKQTNEESSYDWKVDAHNIANRIARERFDRGEREITARNICEAVARELEKNNKSHGQRGPRPGNSVRKDALKGWKFTQPKGGATGTTGAS